MLVGASSLHSNPNTSDLDWIELAKNLSKHVYSDGGFCLHPDTKNRKDLQKILKNFDAEETIIVWRNVINNTITKHPYEKRNTLTTAELLSEIRALPQIAGIIYLVREGADDIHNELKTLPIPSVHVIKDLISNSKRKINFKTIGYKEFHQDHTLELHSLKILVNNGCDIQRLLSKERKQNKKQRKAQRSKFENHEQD